MSRISQETIDKIITMSPHHSNRGIAKELGVGRTTVNKVVNAHKRVDAPESKEDAEDIVALANSVSTYQKSNARLRRIQRKAEAKESIALDILEGVRLAVRDTQVIQSEPPQSLTYKIKSSCKPTSIVEILFSDLQIGKIGQHYSTPVAQGALQYYGEQLIANIKAREDKYKIGKIIFASLGDIVEDHLKHGVQSSTSTDSGLSEQISNALQGMWKYVIQPLAALGYPMEVIGIPGNHGSSGHKGMDMFKAGLFSYDYVIYQALKGFCEVGGYSNVTFNIPEGVFGHTRIFRSIAVYEHGYFNTCTEKSMNDQMKKRGGQLKQHVEFFRCGDMHHLCSFDNHRLVLNGAFFGIDTEGVEFSGILGFSAVPCQVMMFHTSTRGTLGVSSVEEFISIQVAKGYPR